MACHSSGRFGGDADAGIVIRQEIVALLKSDVYWRGHNEYSLMPIPVRNWGTSKRRIGNGKAQGLRSGRY